MLRTVRQALPSASPRTKDRPVSQLLEREGAGPAQVKEREVMRWLRQWLARRRLSRLQRQHEALNAAWAKNRRAQLSQARRERVATIIETGVRP